MLAALLFAACDPPAGPDAGPAPDGGADDSGATGFDAGPTDAGPTDAEVVGDDGGPPDAGPPTCEVPLSPSTAPVASGGGYDVYALETLVYDIFLGCEIFAPTASEETTSLPFDFPYFGDTIPAGTTVTATDSGQLLFGAVTPTRSNVSLPRAGGMGGIAAFWDDLLLGGLCAGSDAAHVSAGWRVAENRDAEGGPVDAFLELSTDGEIALTIYAWPDSRPGSLSGTIGVDSLDGSQGVQLPCSPSCDTPDLTAVTRYLFRPSALGAPARVVPVCAPALPSSMYLDELDRLEGITLTVEKRGAPANPSLGVYLLLSGTRAAYDDDALNLLTPFAAGGAVPAGLLEGERVDVRLGTSSKESWAPRPGRYHAFWQVGEELTHAGELEILDWLGRLELVTDPTLPTATVGDAYAVRLEALGSPAPMYVVEDPSELPPGLSLSADGTLSGTPTTAGTYVFGVEATEAHYEYARASFTLRVR